MRTRNLYQLTDLTEVRTPFFGFVYRRHHNKFSPNPMKLNDPFTTHVFRNRSVVGITKTQHTWSITFLI